VGKIVISENVSLDGVIQDPAGVEGFRLGGWVGLIGGQGRQEAARARRPCFSNGTAELRVLSARWPSRTGALANRLNSLPKYVVSSTLESPAWNNTTVLKGNVIDEVSKLK